MKRLPNDLSALENFLRPETELEYRLLRVPEFRHGLLWGEPRFGHPEGQIALHIREVLDNIDRVPHLTPQERIQLRLIAWMHDTFKYAEDRSRPRDWTKHHGILARVFLESYTCDQIVLDIVAMHDDAYYIWLHARHAQPYVPPHNKTLHKLLHDTAHCLQLYYIFFKCDTQTGDKTQAPVRWFEGSVEGIRIFQL